MLKKELKRSSRHNEDGALPELIGKDLERNLDTAGMSESMSEEDMDADVIAEEDEENVEEIEDDSDEDDIPDSLETELEEPEEHFKDINEKVVTYLYRGFKELGDNVRVYLDDEENEERDPNLIDSLNEFMEGYSEVMDFIQNFAKDYVSDLELIGLENDAEANPDDMEEIPDEEVEEEDLEAEDLEVVESYIKENNLDHNVFENEYEIYARYSSDAEARKYEENLKKFKSAEVFRHEDIGEVHAYIRVKKG